MRDLVVNWLVNVTGRHSSQFIHVPDKDLFEMFFSTFHEMYFNQLKEAAIKKRLVDEFGNALAESIKAGRYF